MTSQLDDEGLHPMVSTLLSGSLATAVPPVKRYSRERMMELRMTKESQTRPETLSEDFNGEDGKFSPLKWLEHRWEIEGIKNRPLSKKIDSLCAGADENTGLSPQRRAFSSGCKAPTDDKGRDGEYERLGGHGKNWRNGSNGGADKFASRGNDFKPAFQKSGQLERGGGGPRKTDWNKDVPPRPGNNNANKFGGGQRRDDRLGSVSGSEKLPEWADGPTTMDDMIELRGFDEPKKGKNKKAPKDKKEKPADIPECGGSSRPSSTGPLTNNKGNVEQIGDSAIESAEIAYPQTGGALPATDTELAALLGVLDIQKTSRKAGGKDDNSWPGKSEEQLPAGSSRLSRFFGKKSKSPELAAAAGNEENVANPMLAKLFGHGAGGDANTNAPPPSGGMRLEDLEKGIEAKEQPASKVSPLQDPSQQAQLMAHLHKMAKQQAEQQAAMHHHQQHRHTPPQQMHHPMVHPNMPIVADPGLLASFAANPIALNTYVDNQLQEAVNAAVRANNGQPIPQQLHEQLRMASIRNKAFLQSQTLTFVSLQQQHQQMQQQHQQQHKGRTPAMIPASVQRQLQKSQVEQQQKKEKSQSPPETSAEGAEESSQLKKLHMQHNYANMMQAMNSGLGWNNQQRGSSAGQQQAPSGQQQLPPNVQMLMAQHQQVAQMHHMKMMMGRAQQQQMLMAKLMQMQQAQQQQQQQMASMQERHGISQQQPLPSELSQVGPIQTPLEKLLASVGVQGSQFTGSGDRIPSSARPMSLEDLEKQLTAAQQK